MTSRAMSIAMEALGTRMWSNRLRLNSLKTKFIGRGHATRLGDAISLVAGINASIIQGRRESKGRGDEGERRMQRRI